MTKPRKSRSDSVPARVAAFQRAAIVQVPPIELTGHALTVWRAAIACRDDWQPHELGMMARMCEYEAGVLKWQAELEAIGDPILNGKPHPLCTVIDMTERRILAMARHLQMHARTQRGEVRDVARGRRVPDLGDMDDLIARPDEEFKH